MSLYYRPRRTKNIYNPKSQEPFRLSRSRIDLFLECARCFYIDRRLGVDRPPGFPFSLNAAVDKLLKKEFDVHRAEKSTHPLMEQYGIDAVPFEHPMLDVWRENFKGLEFHHKPTNFVITGALDDIWVNPKGELIVVDYKATAKDAPVSIDAEWQEGYKRQLEVYQWLLMKNGFKVSPTGYFVYVNGKTDRMAFDKKLEFDIDIIPYTGSIRWIEPTLADIKKCLSATKSPRSSPECDYCAYRDAVDSVTQTQPRLL